MVPPSIVKFRVEFLSHDAPDDERLGQLREWCVRFDHSGLTPPFEGVGRSLGNLSFRLRPDDPAFVITASTLMSKQDLTPADFVTVFRCDLERRTVYAAGKRDPSSESLMHFEIYKRRPDVAAIFHGHDQQITAQAALLDVPETEEFRPPGTPELLDQVMAILNDQPFLVMKKHGFLSFGPNMEEAGNQALEIKKNLQSSLRPQSGEGAGGEGASES
jgi:ribulose-5-phosphate 4-epimerase/fuculose-1-phosphate aldolase